MTALTLEVRVERISDRLALRELALRYFAAVDARDFVSLERLFAPDAKMGLHEGPVAIANRSRIARSSLGITIHTLDFALFEFQSSELATGVIRAHAEMEQSGRTVVAALQYSDRYAKSASDWKISRRELDFYYACPWDDVATSLTAHRRVRRPGEEPQFATLPQG
jgi:SnoaL-like protein